MNLFSKCIVVLLCCALFSAQGVSAAGIVSGNATASMYDSQFGLVNFDTDNGEPIDVSSSGITGNAWGDFIGWIEFSGDNFAVDVTCQSDGTAELSGYAWGENASWINFSPSQGGVTIDADGYFDGNAWSTNYGWMTFDKTQCPGGDGCVQTSFACTSGDGQVEGSVPSCNLQASPQVIQSEGDAVMLSWDLHSTNPDTITLSGNGGTYGPDDTIIVHPNGTTTYVGTVRRGSTERTCAVTVTYQIPSAKGCTNPTAKNFNKYAEEDDGTCVFSNECYALSNTGDSQANSCGQCPYFHDYLRMGSNGAEVKKVQTFLNTYMGESLLVDGHYGWSTAKAVGRFQQRHFNDIIVPWHPPYPLKVTNRWYKTTSGTANIIVGCKAPDINLENTGKTHSFFETVQRLFNTFFGVSDN